jgi:hypothetical protein
MHMQVRTPPPIPTSKRIGLISAPLEASREAYLPDHTVPPGTVRHCTAREGMRYMRHDFADLAVILITSMY